MMLACCHPALNEQFRVNNITTGFSPSLEQIPIYSKNIIQKKCNLTDISNPSCCVNMSSLADGGKQLVELILNSAPLNDCRIWSDSDMTFSFKELQSCGKHHTSVTEEGYIVIWCLSRLSISFGRPTSLTQPKYLAFSNFWHLCYVFMHNLKMCGWKLVSLNFRKRE